MKGLFKKSDLRKKNSWVILYLEESRTPGANNPDGGLHFFLSLTKGKADGKVLLLRFYSFIEHPVRPARLRLISMLKRLLKRLIRIA